MKNHTRYLLVIVVLICLGVFSAFYRPKNVPVKNNIENLDLKIDGWYFVRDIEMNKEAYEALDPQSLIFREYKNDEGRQVTLTGVYHRNDRWGAHDPIVCYKSQGWKIIQRSHKVKIEVKNHDFFVNRFMVKKEAAANLIYYYYFSSNKKIRASRNKQMIDMVLNGMIHGFTESGFIEISASINPLNEEEVVRSIDDFVGKFTQILEKVL